MAKDVIVALDFDNKDEVLSFLKQFKKPIFTKVGMELFYSEGISIIEEIKKMNHKIFLDLKLHDIPNTVSKSLESLKKLNVDIIDVHSAGGSKMLKQAAQVFKDSKTKLVAITQLTSTSNEMLVDELMIHYSMDGVVLNYAKLAYDSGLDGVVCSAWEAKSIHEDIAKDFITICPGIRLEKTDDDQVRVVNPSQAKELTCDYIVVGRPITKANDSLAAYKKIYQQFVGEKYE